MVNVSWARGKFPKKQTRGGGFDAKPEYMTKKVSPRGSANDTEEYTNPSLSLTELPQQWRGGNTSAMAHLPFQQAAPFLPAATLGAEAYSHQNLQHTKGGDAV